MRRSTTLHGHHRVAAPLTALGGLGGLASTGCAPGPPPLELLSSDSSLALFAVGDTGRRSHGMGRWSSGGRMAGAITAMHRQSPATV